MTMERKVFTLIGRNVNSMEEFHDEVQKTLCPNFKHYGRSWNAFNDILRGGFGMFELDEEITLIVKNKKHLKKQLGEGFLNRIERIVKAHAHIQLLFE